MIRDFRQEDTEEIDSLIKHLDAGYEIDDVKYINENATKFLVYGKETIKGLAYTTVSKNDADEKEVQIRIYVEPQSRNKGIGTALFNELETYVNKLEVDLLTAYIRDDRSNSSSFCHKKGFKMVGFP